jgi:hypothetical protein
MRLFYGSGPCPFHMSATKRYEPCELQRRADKLLQNNQRLFLQVENEFHPLKPVEIPLAAALAASYHNQVCHNIPQDDGWNAETQLMESMAQAHMDAGMTDESDGDADG